jgi:hypothetical protein
VEKAEKNRNFLQFPAFDILRRIFLMINFLWHSFECARGNRLNGSSDAASRRPNNPVETGRG